MAHASDAIKIAALRSVKTSADPVALGHGVFRVGAVRIHTRFKATASGGRKFPFNYGFASDAADFDLWVCGSTSDYYLIPKAVLQEMFDDPDAYPDRSRPNLRVLTLDLDSDHAAYARGGKTRSFRAYRNAKL